MKFILLLIFFFTLLLYIPLNRQIPRYRLRLRLDEHIPLIPWTVWIYVSYYFLVPISIFLLWPTNLFLPFLISQIAVTVISSAIWKLFPNGVVRPKITDATTYHHSILKLIYRHDNDSNGLPSGHVGHTFISCYFLSIAFPQLWIIFFLILIAISFSTLTTKQHYYLDMVSTLAITPLFIEATHYLMYIIRS